jgi:S1-C subfamily serine protease
MKNKNSSFQKTGLFMVFTLCCVGALAFGPPDFAVAGNDVRDSMVKIYCVQNEPDYDNPWNMSGPEAFSGSGAVIEGSRILTNAHVVSDHTFIQVRLHGHSRKYPAKVIAVSHEADLALLTVDDSSFFKGVKPLKLGKLPEIEQEVTVYGFPEGGDSLSTTKGVVSRIENRRYAHSLIELLAGQLDAAINSGNSGGPVMVGNRIAGVVMQTRKESENIGYMVPAPVIKHFLIDMEDGHYDGFPEDGIRIQPLENASLKKMYGLNDDQSGALVVSVIPGSAAENKLFPGDVILSIDGHRVADDCTVEFRPKERTSSDFYVQQHQIGENVVYKILRSDREKTVNFTLDKNCGNSRLVPNYRYDVRPSYYVYGGLVFSPLTLNYIMTWGNNWTEDAPFNLVNFFTHGLPVRENEEVVTIIKILPSDVNNGYGNFTNERVVEVNGKKILNLHHLISILENSTKDSFAIFKTKKGHTIALDRKKVEDDQDAILSTYDISDDRSSDLKTAVNSNKTKSNELAKASSAQVN